VELHEDRVVNGVLKAGLQANTPAAVQEILDVDVEIVVPEGRAVVGDLWPGVWALAAVTSRQFLGHVVVHGVSNLALPAPAALGPRCVLAREYAPSGRTVISLGLGGPAARGGMWGDARGAEIRLGGRCSGSEPAHPAAVFALAGYLGFAALATQAGIPPFRADLCVDCLELGPLPDAQLPDDGLAVLGLGHLGQAYLALLYFLRRNMHGALRLHVLDKDAFGPENRATQILFDDDSMAGQGKAHALATKFQRSGWTVEAHQAELTWESTRSAGEPRVALLGFDNHDARRMALAAGYDWVVDAGLRDSFTEPIVTWHSVPGGGAHVNMFPRSPAAREALALTGAFFEELRATPGGCGWLTFEAVTASAPSMGLAAAAYVWRELLQYLAGSRVPYRGCARVWSPFLPLERTEVPAGPQAAAARAPHRLALGGPSGVTRSDPPK